MLHAPAGQPACLTLPYSSSDGPLKADRCAAPAENSLEEGADAPSQGLSRGSLGDFIDNDLDDAPGSSPPGQGASPPGAARPRMGAPRLHRQQDAIQPGSTPFGAPSLLDADMGPEDGRLWCTPWLRGAEAEPRSLCFWTRAGSLQATYTGSVRLSGTRKCAAGLHRVQACSHVWGDGQQLLSNALGRRAGHQALAGLQCPGGRQHAEGRWLPRGRGGAARRCARAQAAPAAERLLWLQPCLARAPGRGPACVALHGRRLLLPGDVKLQPRRSGQLLRATASHVPSSQGWRSGRAVQLWERTVRINDLAQGLGRRALPAAAGPAHGGMTVRCPAIPHAVGTRPTLRAAQPRSLRRGLRCRGRCMAAGPRRIRPA